MGFVYLENCVNLLSISIWEHLTFQNLLKFAEVLHFACIFNWLYITYLWNVYPVHRQMGALKHDINQYEIQKDAVAYRHLRPSTGLSVLCQSGQRAWDPFGSAQKTTHIFMQIEHFTWYLLTRKHPSSCLLMWLVWLLGLLLPSSAALSLPWQTLCQEEAEGEHEVWEFFFPDFAWEEEQTYHCIKDGRIDCFSLQCRM